MKYLDSPHIHLKSPHLSQIYLNLLLEVNHRLLRDWTEPKLGPRTLTYGDLSYDFKLPETSWFRWRSWVLLPLIHNTVSTISFTCAQWLSKASKSMQALVLEIARIWHVLDWKFYAFLTNKWKNQNPYLPIWAQLWLDFDRTSNVTTRLIRSQFVAFIVEINVENYQVIYKYSNLKIQWKALIIDGESLN